MKKILMIDDMKDPSIIIRPGYTLLDKSPNKRFTEEEVEVARTYDDGLNLLQNRQWDMVLLDHDLGGQKTGYDIVCWLEENISHCPKEVMLITFNPSGGAKMEQAINKLEERGVTKYAGWFRG